MSQTTALSTRTRSPIASPVRVAAAAAQLAALGVAGPVFFTILFVLLSLGVSLVLVLGIGLVFLIGFIYGLFALSWLETARIDALYDFGLPARRTCRSPRTGFGGFLHTLWLQFIDAGMWRAAANAALATILGLILLPLLGLLGSGAALAFAPLLADSGTVALGGTWIEVVTAWATPAGIIAVVFSLLAIAGLAILHGVISRAILVPSRQAQLVEEARISGVQRAGAVRAAEVERTRIERDLHDGGATATRLGRHDARARAAEDRDRPLGGEGTHRRGAYVDQGRRRALGAGVAVAHPLSSQARAVPSVGCPANGNSVFRLKMRTR